MQAGAHRVAGRTASGCRPGRIGLQAGAASHLVCAQHLDRAERLQRLPLELLRVGRLRRLDLVELDACLG